MGQNCASVPVCQNVQEVSARKGQKGYWLCTHICKSGFFLCHKLSAKGFYACKQATFIACILISSMPSSVPSILCHVVVPSCPFLCDTLLSPSPTSFSYVGTRFLASLKCSLSTEPWISDNFLAKGIRSRRGESRARTGREACRAEMKAVGWRSRVISFQIIASRKRNNVYDSVLFSA